MRKVSIYVPAYGGCTVKFEVPEDMTEDQVKEKAYQEASLSDGSLYDWDYEAELEIIYEDKE